MSVYERKQCSIRSVNYQGSEREGLHESAHRQLRCNRDFPGMHGNHAAID
jgi:hypothetical protein